jgi:hypothetical protein
MCDNYYAALKTNRSFFDDNIQASGKFWTKSPLIDRVGDLLKGFSDAEKARVPALVRQKHMGAFDSKHDMSPVEELIKEEEISGYLDGSTMMVQHDGKVYDFGDLGTVPLLVMERNLLAMKEQGDFLIPDLDSNREASQAAIISLDRACSNTLPTMDVVVDAFEVSLRNRIIRQERVKGDESFRFLDTVSKSAVCMYPASSMPTATRYAVLAMKYFRRTTPINLIVDDSEEMSPFERHVYELLSMYFEVFVSEGELQGCSQYISMMCPFESDYGSYHSRATQAFIRHWSGRNVIFFAPLVSYEMVGLGYYLEPPAFLHEPMAYYCPGDEKLFRVSYGAQLNRIPIVEQVRMGFYESDLTFPFSSWQVHRYEMDCSCFRRPGTASRGFDTYYNSVFPGLLAQVPPNSAFTLASLMKYGQIPAYQKGTLQSYLRRRVKGGELVSLDSLYYDLPSYDLAVRISQTLGTPVGVSPFVVMDELPRDRLYMMTGTITEDYCNYLSNNGFDYFVGFSPYVQFDPQPSCDFIEFHVTLSGSYVTDRFISQPFPENCLALMPKLCSPKGGRVISSNGLFSLWLF